MRNAQTQKKEPATGAFPGDRLINTDMKTHIEDDTAGQVRMHDAELEKLRHNYPGLDFEDRCNRAHLRRYDEYNLKGERVRTTKAGKDKESALRFQAIRRTVQELNLPAIPGRGAVRCSTSVRVLVAWAATPSQLGQILAVKGGVR